MQKSSTDVHGTITLFFAPQIVLACLVVAALAAPKPEDFPPLVQVLRDEREHGTNGKFKYLIETDNGIFMEAVGTPGLLGQSNIQGSYRCVLGLCVSLKARDRMTGAP